MNGLAQTRICSHCRQTLALDSTNFYRHKLRGYQRYCKTCSIAVATARNKAKPEDMARYQAKYGRTPERKAQRRRYQAKYDRTPERKAQRRIYDQVRCRVRRRMIVPTN